MYQEKLHGVFSCSLCDASPGDNEAHTIHSKQRAVMWVSQHGAGTRFKDLLVNKRKKWEKQTLELNPHLGCLKFIFRLRRWEEREGSQSVSFGVC